ncbi:hypothetical protein M501DRAFT_171180 [Patellaria atrata CBS 101060]|uniref:P-loop containing nucleoside triphosphate hydrolase protein n=1 Tax=Patellaria atrata CBS 101060 TaxID=1346257 RepID=A0A9P4S7I8_9PEZI|nr:hypothetical protein M501DRAFT_171180 [Patellaria atrata CBS 101060]
MVDYSKNLHHQHKNHHNLHQTINTMSLSSSEELGRYRAFLKQGAKIMSTSAAEDLATSSLFTWDIKEYAARKYAKNVLEQYSVLGYDSECAENGDDNEQLDPIFINTNAPWSAFICGSQGSGKSYSMSCMLESFFSDSPDIGNLRKPLTGIVFHYDTNSRGGVCEAAYLCTRKGTNVRVLCSPSNIHSLRETYTKKFPDAKNKLRVEELKFHASHLNVERIKMLMALNDTDGEVPLYMEVFTRILRELAIAFPGRTGVNYIEFKKRVQQEGFARSQTGPMNLRMDLLESFMDLGSEDKWEISAFQNTKPKRKFEGGPKSTYFQQRTEDKFAEQKGPALDIFKSEPGEVIIVDLTDPCIDKSSACILFDICLGLFCEYNPGGETVVALDEAHKFMNSSSAAKNFTESLIKVIRLQRHLGSRIIIATQEPSISSDLIALCSMTIVHRFKSPEWFEYLRKVVGDLSQLTEQDRNNIFRQITRLRTGESLVFSNDSFIRLNNGIPERLGTDHFRMQTRMRLTEDGGGSVLAIKSE